MTVEAKNKKEQVAKLLYKFRNTLHQAYIWEFLDNDNESRKCMERTHEIQKKILNIVGD